MYIEMAKVFPGSLLIVVLASIIAIGEIIVVVFFLFKYIGRYLFDMTKVSIMNLLRYVFRN